jgi:hypothetical protein
MIWCKTVYEFEQEELEKRNLWATRMIGNNVLGNHLFRRPGSIADKKREKKSG